MAQSTTYDRQTSFALFTSENPGEPHSGVDLDTEFNAVKVSLDETQANLALIQRDDGTLVAGSVGLEQLDESISLGVRSKGVWATATSYAGDVDTAFHDTKIYRCEIDHVSGTFSVDLAAGKWIELADLGVEVLGPDSVGEAELQDDAVTSNKIEAAAVTTDKVASTSVTLAKLAAEVANRLVPVGTIVPYCALITPAGWLHCNGQSVLRSDYPALFGLFATFFGSVDSLHFNVPNLMGRQIVCMDGIDGAPTTGLVTSAGSGIDATTFGATGGAQTKTLTISQLPTVTPAGSIVVGITDPTHLHQSNDAAAKVGAFTGPGSNGWGGTTTSATSSASTGITGSGTFTGTPFGSGSAHSTMDPAIVFPYIIKAH